LLLGACTASFARTGVQRRRRPDPELGLGLDLAEADRLGVGAPARMGTVEQLERERAMVEVQPTVDAGARTSRGEAMDRDVCEGTQQVAEQHDRVGLVDGNRAKSSSGTFSSDSRCRSQWG
jgi:hypothetical protein